MTIVFDTTIIVDVNFIQLSQDKKLTISNNVHSITIDMNLTGLNDEGILFILNHIVFSIERGVKIINLSNLIKNEQVRQDV